MSRANDWPPAVRAQLEGVAGALAYALGESLLGAELRFLSAPKRWPRSGRWPIELDLVTAADVVPWRYPTACDIQYSERHREPLGPGTSRDLAAHATLLHRAGVAERKLHTKESGAEWALPRVSQTVRPLVAEALAVYRAERDWTEFDPDRVRDYIQWVERQLPGTG